MNTSEEINSILTQESQLIKEKYDNLVKDYSDQIKEASRAKKELKAVSQSNTELSASLKSTCSLVTDMLELFLSQRSAGEHKHSSTKLHDCFSIDVYESMTMNNEEDKKLTVARQLKNMVAAKFSFFTQNLKVDLGEEIERVKGIQQKVSDLSISNIKYSFKKDIHSESSYDSKRFGLDLSTSKIHKDSSNMQNSEDLSVITKNANSKSVDKVKPNMSGSLTEGDNPNKKVVKNKKDYSFECNNSFFTNNEIESIEDKKGDNNPNVFTNLSFNN